MPRLLAVSLATLVALALLAACTSTPPRKLVLPTPGPGPGSGTIVWLANPTAQTATDDVRQVLADAFEQAYPSIKINLESGPTNTDSMRKLLVSKLATGSSTPDVYDGDVIWPYAFASAGYALPLSHYLPASFWESFGPRNSPGSGATMVRALTYRGAIYGVPEFVDEGFLYYRKDLLAAAGIRHPPATWEELAADALILKAHKMHYQFVWQGDNYEGLTCDWYEFMADAFGGLPAGSSVAAELKSPQAVRALTFMRGLIESGVSLPEVKAFQELDADNAFDSGQAAFMRGWDASYAAAVGPVSKLSPAEVGVELPPTFQGETGTGWSALGGWSLFVNPHTANITAALTFVRWMAGPQAQWILATQSSEIPTNASVRQDPAVRALNPVLGAAAGARVVARPATTAHYAQISQAIHDCVWAALPGPGPARLTPDAALAAAARAVGPPVSVSPPCGDGSGG